MLIFHAFSFENGATFGGSDCLVISVERSRREQKLWFNIIGEREIKWMYLIILRKRVTVG